ncbi:MAG TPA: hypothetical protein VFP26_06790 [Gemmatimonadaceae bacterium]|jgi:hypothetical protein|nr:hypothetical protein [Gemmatimonadaceae bacterium]
MSNSSERYESNPHPQSSHRTPSEIAEDERGVIGGNGHRHAGKISANDGPVKKVSEPAEKQEKE